MVRKNLAATYSRGIYKTTTIGKAAFDGRVRNGNGSDHSFMTTKIVAETEPRKRPQNVCLRNTDQVVGPLKSTHMLSE